MTNPDDSSQDDSKRKDPEETDEFLNMDPGAFDGVNDLFADPSMLEEGDDDPDSSEDGSA